MACVGLNVLLLFVQIIPRSSSHFVASSFSSLSETPGRADRGRNEHTKMLLVAPPLTWLAARSAARAASPRCCVDPRSLRPPLDYTSQFAKDSGPIEVNLTLTLTVTLTLTLSLSLSLRLRLSLALH